MTGIGNFTGRRMTLDCCQTASGLSSDTERHWYRQVDGHYDGRKTESMSHRQVILENNQKPNVGVRHFAQKMCRLPPISNSLVEQLCQKISAFFVKITKLHHFTPLLTTFITFCVKLYGKHVGDHPSLFLSTPFQSAFFLSSHSHSFFSF